MPPWPGRDDRGPWRLRGAVRAHIKCAPTVRRGGRCVCRGGLNIRPSRAAIPAAPPPSLVGRHAHMPPWPGRDDRGPWWLRGAVRAHIKCAPTVRRGGRCVCRGGLNIRPSRAAIPAAPPPSLVGRHAHMPPWPGRDDRGLGGCGGLVWRGVGTPPYGPGQRAKIRILTPPSGRGSKTPRRAAVSSQRRAGLSV